MFASTVASVNKNASCALTATSVNGVAKRSKVCDADANGKTHPMCKR